jgi:thioredoxin-like negative regulator of GroEL
MFPHERSLVTRLQNKPFALLGIDIDSDREGMKKFVVEKKVNWRSWLDADNSIAQKWQVTGIPQLYLLDQDGVIRQKWGGTQSAEVLDKAIDDLIQKAEGEKVSFLSK